jgi:hypothetical protein
MNVNLTINYVGSGVSSYTIYQDTDGYLTFVATGVTAASASAGVQLTLDDAAKSVKIVSDCGTEKYMDINFNDATPSIVIDNEVALQVNQYTNYHASVDTDGLDHFLIISGESVRFYLNGTYSDPNPPATFTNDTRGRVQWNGSYFSILLNNGARYKYWDNSGWMLSADSPASVSGVTGTIIDYSIVNGVYYIKTDSSLFRSTDGVNYLSVLTFNPGGSDLKDVNHTIKGYGNYVFVSVGVWGLFKSSDNGLNWTSIPPGFEIGSIFVEDNNKIIAQDLIGTNYQYTIDGGVNWQASWITVPDMNVDKSKSAQGVIKKTGNLYFYTTGTGSDANNLYYTSDDLYTATTGTQTPVLDSRILMTSSVNAPTAYQNTGWNSEDLSIASGKILFARTNINGLVTGQSAKHVSHYTMTAT